MTVDYKTCDEELQGRNKDSKKVGRNTYMQRRGEGVIAIKYHDTDIVTFYENGSVKLDTGGYPTLSTRDRMGAWAPVRLSGNVSSWGGGWNERRNTQWGPPKDNKVKWYITHPDRKGGPLVDFSDEMVLKPMKDGSWLAYKHVDDIELGIVTIGTVRKWTPDERWENFMAMETSFKPVRPGMQACNSSVYGDKRMLEAHKNRHGSWDLELVTLEDGGFDVQSTPLIAGVKTLKPLRRMAYRWNRWEAAAWHMDYDLEHGHDRTERWWEHI